MSDPFYGEIRAFAFDYPPRDWAFCQGQTMLAQQNPALYTVIGNRYGGTSPQNFNLPDLRSQAPMGEGPGPGLTPRTTGQAVGKSTETLQPAHMPPHEHAIAVHTGNATTNVPKDKFLAAGRKPAAIGTQPQPAYAPSPLDAPLAPTALTPFGGGQAHDNMQPYLALNLCICLQGEFPTRP
ncbi:phage tail protein [Acidovorax sp. YS12]|nr:phage tail protein [Acidovorax sp. YS12]